ncbi:glyoxalase-superfamily protein [Rhodococcus triatomae BKS 15-14]|nr:glyoxalase-superfamily protein [Rhodococcus triatomae BKS 15-14]
MSHWPGLARGVTLDQRDAERRTIPLTGGNPPDLRTDDAAARLEAAEAAGGSVMVPPMAVGDEGTMAVVTDPAGAVIGFWQPDRHQGFSQWGEHGTPYWFECHSKDHAKSIDFYPKDRRSARGDRDGRRRLARTGRLQPGLRRRLVVVGHHGHLEAQPSRGAVVLAGVRHIRRCRRHRRAGRIARRRGPDSRRGHPVRDARNGHRPVRRGLLPGPPTGRRVDTRHVKTDGSRRSASGQTGPAGNTLAP